VPKFIECPVQNTDARGGHGRHDDHHHHHSVWGDGREYGDGSGVSRSGGGHILPAPSTQEAISYTGPFIGRARALVDYTPSPYDRDALRFKVSIHCWGFCCTISGSNEYFLYGSLYNIFPGHEMDSTLSASRC
jgi:hypothetical protein